MEISLSSTDLHDARPSSRSGRPAWPETDRYAALELTSGSALSTELAAMAEHEEATDGRVKLTDDLSAWPAGMTPRMVEWWMTQIQPLRVRALEEIRSAFEGDALSSSSSGRGVFVDGELDRVQQNRTRDLERCLRDFHANASHLANEQEEASRDYQQMHAREGREPDIHPGPVYGAILALIVIIEAFLNWESLLRLPSFSPAMATAAAVVIGAVITYAAHEQGTVLKQYSYWFGPHDKARFYQGVRRLILSAAALSVGLAAIGTARFFLLLPEVDRAILLGLEPPSIPGSILMLSMMNLAVFLVGVGVAFWFHDQNPQYVKAYNRAEAARAAYRHRFQTGVTREMARIDEKYRQDVALIRNMEKSMQSSPALKENSQAYARFQATDDAVRAALVRYKGTLVKVLKDRGLTPEFYRETVSSEDGVRLEQASAADFLAAQLHLKRILSTAG